MSKKVNQEIAKGILKNKAFYKLNKSMRARHIYYII